MSVCIQWIYVVINNGVVVADKKGKITPASKKVVKFCLFFVEKGKIPPPTENKPQLNLIFEIRHNNQHGLIKLILTARKSSVGTHLKPETLENNLNLPLSLLAFVSITN